MGTAAAVGKLPFSNSCSSLSTALASFFCWALSSRRFWKLGRKHVLLRLVSSRSILGAAEASLPSRAASSRLPKGPQGTMQSVDNFRLSKGRQGRG